MKLATDTRAWGVAVAGERSSEHGSVPSNQRLEVPPGGFATLSRVDTLTTAQQVRDLRAAVFSNLDGLFAFHTSAEDARFLAPELGGGLDEQEMLELGLTSSATRWAISITLATRSERQWLSPSIPKR